MKPLISQQKGTQNEEKQDTIKTPNQIQANKQNLCNQQNRQNECWMFGSIFWTALNPNVWAQMPISELWACYSGALGILGVRTGVMARTVGARRAWVSFCTWRSPPSVSLIKKKTRGQDSRSVVEKLHQ